MKRIVAFCLGSALLFCGCRTVEVAREAQKPENIPLGIRTVTAQEIGLTAGGTYSLAELERLGATYAPSVLQAKESYESAKLSLADAKAGYLPSASLSAGHNRSTHNTNRHRETTRNTGSWSGGLSMNWTVYDFGKTKSAVSVAQARLDAAMRDYQTAQCVAVLAVRVAFFELKRNMELEQVSAQAEQQYKEHYEQVKSLQEVGKSTAYDVLKAEVDYNTAALNHITTSHNVENSWCDLNAAIGLAEAPEYNLGTADIKNYELDVEKLMELARERDPELASLHAKVDAATAYIDQAIAELYPTLGVNLGATVSGRNPGLPWLWNLSGGASLAETIFNGGTNLRRIDSAVISLQQARIQVASREQTLYKMMRKAVLTALRAEKQLEFARTAQRSAEQNLEIVNERFNQGKASSVERTDAQVANSQAQANVVTAIYDRLDALAAIARFLSE